MGRSKHGPAWYLTHGRMEHMNNDGSPSFPSPLASSSSLYSSGLCGPGPLSSPWACLVDWFDSQSILLGFTLGLVSNVFSSSKPFSFPFAPRVVSPPMFQQHNCNTCGDCSCLLASMETLQSLVFDVRRPVDDLRFKLEIVNCRGELLEALLTTLLSHGSRLDVNLHFPVLEHVKGVDAPTTRVMDSNSHLQDTENGTPPGS